MHGTPNAYIVESNNRNFSWSIIDLSYWALEVNTLHWCINEEKKKFPGRLCDLTVRIHTTSVHCVKSHSNPEQTLSEYPQNKESLTIAIASFRPIFEYYICVSNNLV